MRTNKKGYLKSKKFLENPEAKKMVEGIKKSQEAIKKTAQFYPNIKNSLGKSFEKLRKATRERNKQEAKHKEQAFIQTEQNKKMLKLTRQNLILSLLVLGIILLTFLYGNYNEKTKEIGVLITQINGLDLELEANYDSMEQIQAKVEGGILTGEIFTGSSRSVLLNGNLRNQTIKRRTITLTFDFSELSKSIERIDTISDKELQKTTKKQIKEIISNKKIKERISELRILIGLYKKCIIKERNFNRC